MTCMGVCVLSCVCVCFHVRVCVFCRYKQLLLKQRDIMIALTSRLNERDETIARLQEELDAYDTNQVSLSLSLSLHIYIYIYIIL